MLNFLPCRFIFCKIVLALQRLILLLLLSAYTPPPLKFLKVLSKFGGSNYNLIAITKAKIDKSNNIIILIVIPLSFCERL